MRFLRQTGIAVLLFSVTGCSAICEAMIEGLIDSAFETSEDRRLRVDCERTRRGQPLRYYDDAHDLKKRKRAKAEEDFYDSFRFGS